MQDVKDSVFYQSIFFTAQLWNDWTERMYFVSTTTWMHALCPGSWVYTGHAIRVTVWRLLTESTLVRRSIQDLEKLKRVEGAC